MIKSTEIREGNLLYDCAKNVGSVVIGLGKFELATRQRGFVSIEECAPIPLTPEILEKAGFKKNDDVSAFSSDEKERIIYSFKNFHISFEDSKFYMWNLCDDSYFSYSYPLLQSLHQLQNLYFPFTGNELEIQL